MNNPGDFVFENGLLVKYNGADAVVTMCVENPALTACLLDYRNQNVTAEEQAAFTAGKIKL